jgi:anti-sigma B factor antagonist
VSHLHALLGPGTVTATGELDLVSAPTLTDAITTVAARWANVTIDLSAVTFMDGAGLSVLVGARRRMLADGTPLRLRTPHERVRHVLRLTNLETAFTIV